jgi:HlyD family secretion protein
MNTATSTPDTATAYGRPTVNAATPGPQPEAAVAGAAGVDRLLGEGASRPWWRRPLWWLFAAAGVAIAGFVGVRWQADTTANGPHYITEPVARGDLAITVSANGTLQPTRAVNVGSELSGTVAQVFVDINDRVKQGQVLALLDTARLRDQIARSRASVASSEAKVAQAAATLKEAHGNLARLQEVQRLSAGKVPSQAELETAQAAVDRAVADQAVAGASVADARAALSSDETNLAKASIRSPIAGVVLTRAVDPGNAVAASLQAVTLFTLAEDLTRMKLQVNVDEADVGQVTDGQSATFTVSAYPNRKYPAKITRVGYGATTKDNVVTYLAELEVENKDLTLRPGMTATATIAAAQRTGVLLVPNAALRFAPQSPNEADAKKASSGSPGIVARLMPRLPRQEGQRKPGNATPGARQVYVLRDGAPVAVAVTQGLSDGRRTEVQGPDLHEGDLVITDQTAGTP